MMIFIQSILILLTLNSCTPSSKGASPFLDSFSSNIFSQPTEETDTLSESSQPNAEKNTSPWPFSQESEARLITSKFTDTLEHLVPLLQTIINQTYKDTSPITKNILYFTDLLQGAMKWPILPSLLPKAVSDLTPYLSLVPMLCVLFNMYYALKGQMNVFLALPRMDGAKMQSILFQQYSPDSLAMQYSMNNKSRKLASDQSWYEWFRSLPSTAKDSFKSTKEKIAEMQKQLEFIQNIYSQLKTVVDAATFSEEVSKRMIVTGYLFDLFIVIENKILKISAVANSDVFNKPEFSKAAYSVGGRSVISNSYFNDLYKEGPSKTVIYSVASFQLPSLEPNDWQMSYCSGIINSRNNDSDNSIPGVTGGVINTHPSLYNCDPSNSVPLSNIGKMLKNSGLGTLLGQRP